MPMFSRQYFCAIVHFQRKQTEMYLQRAHNVHLWMGLNSCTSIAAWATGDIYLMQSSQTFCPISWPSCVSCSVAKVWTTKLKNLLFQGTPRKARSIKHLEIAIATGDTRDPVFANILQVVLCARSRSPGEKAIKRFALLLDLLQGTRLCMGERPFFEESYIYFCILALGSISSIVIGQKSPKGCVFLQQQTLSVAYMLKFKNILVTLQQPPVRLVWPRVFVREGQALGNIRLYCYVLLAPDRRACRTENCGFQLLVSLPVSGRRQTVVFYPLSQNMHFELWPEQEKDSHFRSFPWQRDDPCMVDVAQRKTCRDKSHRHLAHWGWSVHLSNHFHQLFWSQQCNSLVCLTWTAVGGVHPRKEEHVKRRHPAIPTISTIVCIDVWTLVVAGIKRFGWPLMRTYRGTPRFCMTRCSEQDSSGGTCPPFVTSPAMAVFLTVHLCLCLLCFCSIVHSSRSSISSALSRCNRTKLDSFFANKDRNESAEFFAVASELFSTGITFRRTCSATLCLCVQNFFQCHHNPNSSVIV